ncbi:hypothetical protein PsYK624_019050 [Phanerochaete sordida]|uniref:Uncharacterized protein n=1 Tax=Phanerochaete sordida TaxID=48140 RepID=A0A9P3L883_9APHY|nr:hypothetical protein PsYK624_019050 [Phanerochaete sordida]
MSRNSTTSLAKILLSIQHSYPLRLPSSHSSCCARYRPYGRRVASYELDPMKTIDMRFYDTRDDSRASLCLSVLEEDEETGAQKYERDLRVVSTGTNGGGPPLVLARASRALLLCV